MEFKLTLEEEKNTPTLTEDIILFSVLTLLQIQESFPLFKDHFKLNFSKTLNFGTTQWLSSVMLPFE